MGDVLQEYISLIVEKLRGDKPFDVNKLRQLETRREVVLYAQSTGLKKIGMGSSRAAFVLSSKKVLKVALNSRGVAQNQAEIKVFQNPASKDWVTHIFDYDHQFKWVISEIVRQITPQEFLANFGANMTSITRTVTRLRKNPDFDFRDFIARSTPDEDPQIVDRAVEIVNSLLEFCKATGVLSDDLDDIEHWGKTADGRIVCLDTGFTDEVEMLHY